MKHETGLIFKQERNLLIHFVFAPEKKAPPTDGFRKVSPGVQVEGPPCVTEGMTVKEEEEEEQEEGQVRLVKVSETIYL